jgi:putative colanic acid biosynthesis acetyltransferase WcaF
MPEPPTPPQAHAAPQVDVSHYSSRFTLGHKVARALWRLVWLILFRPSPTFFYGWRRFLLRRFGAKLHRTSVVYPSTQVWAPWNLTMEERACLGPHVDCYSVDTIHIGSHATVSQHATLCAASHDISDPGMRLITAPITISPSAWVAAGAFIQPGRTIGEGGVVAAMACVVKDVGPWEIHGGNPAVFLKRRELKAPQT